MHVPTRNASARPRLPARTLTRSILVVRDVLPPAPSPAPTLGKRSADTGISWFATSRAMRLADKSAFRSAMHARRLLVESEDD